MWLNIEACQRLGDSFARVIESVCRNICVVKQSDHIQRRMHRPENSLNQTARTLIVGKEAEHVCS
jgi:hypothetical protein